jgi:general secretion pathway protein J
VIGRSPASHRRSMRSCGMTLIEVLVALALLSMLSIGLTTAFRVGHGAYERVVKQGRSYWDVAVAQRFLRGALESVYPFQPGAASGQAARGLEGESDRLSLTAELGAGGAVIGHRRYTLSLMSRGNGRSDLVATAQADRDGSNAAQGADDASRPETVVAGVASVEWSYYDARAGSTGWHSSWSEQKPPALVRLRVRFPQGDSRVWPDLLVAPRITDDANCQFDVVAQACREDGS